MRFKWVAAAVILLPYTAGAPASAQEIAVSFNELSGRIRVGERLIITDTRGATIDGRLSGLAGSSMDIRFGRNRATPLLRLTESDVNNIVAVRRDRLWNGPLIGFAAGAGTAAAIELINSRGSQKFQGGSVVALGNLSAIIGLVFDLINKEKVTVYVQTPTSRI
jgi:hypothetical protein